MQVWGEEMDKRMTVQLTSKLMKELETYMLGVHNTQGKMPYAFKSKITRQALEEWLERHGEDYDINWDEVN